MLHFQSLTNVRNFILTFNPSTLSVPCNVISSFLSNPQHYISLTKEFHRYFQPLIVAFLISPLQRNFTLSFSPSTLHFLSNSRRGTSTLLSDPQYYISHKSLTNEFHPLNTNFSQYLHTSKLPWTNISAHHYFLPIPRTFSALQSLKVSSELAAPTLHNLTSINIYTGKAKLSW